MNCQEIILQISGKSTSGSWAALKLGCKKTWWNKSSSVSLSSDQCKFCFGLRVLCNGFSSFFPFCLNLCVYVYMYFYIYAQIHKYLMGSLKHWVWGGFLVICSVWEYVIFFTAFCRYCSRPSGFAKMLVALWIRFVLGNWDWMQFLPALKQKATVNTVTLSLSGLVQARFLNSKASIVIYWFTHTHPYGHQFSEKVLKQPFGTCSLRKKGGTSHLIICSCCLYLSLSYISTVLAVFS